MKQLLQNRAPRRWLVPGGGAATAGDGEGGGAVVGNLGFGGGRAPAPGFRQRSFVFPPLPILGWADRLIVGRVDIAYLVDSHSSPGTFFSENSSP